MKLRADLSVIGLILLVTTVPFARACVGGEVMVNGDWLAAHFEPFHGSWPRVRAQNAELEDPVLSSYSLKTAAAAALREGHVPLWNPWIAAGTPFLADSISTPFHPFALALVLGGPQVGWNLFLWLHLAIAGVGAYAFLRALAIGRAGAFLGAASYAVSGFHMVWLEYGTMIAGNAFLPLALLAVEQRLKSARHHGAHIVALAAITALQAYCGNVQNTAFFAAFVAAYAALRLRWRGADALRHAVAIGVALGVGLLLAAPQLLPTLDLAGATRRSTTKYAGVNHVHPATLITWLLPDLFGNPAADNHVGRYLTGQPFEHIHMGYVGAVAFGLGIMGVARSQIRARLPLALAAVAIPLLLVALHSDTARQLVGRAWPAFHSFDWKRTRYFSAFALAALGAAGLDACLRRPELCRKTARHLALLVVVVVGGLLLTETVASRLDSPTGFLGYFAAVRGHQGTLLTTEAVLRPLVALALVACVLWLMARGRLGARSAGSIVVAVGVVELLAWGLPYNPSTPAARLFPPLPILDAIPRTQDDRARVAAVTPVFGRYSWDITEREGRLLPPNTLLPYRIEDPRSFSTFYLDRYIDLMELHEQRRNAFPFSIQLTRPTSPILDLLNVRWLVSADRLLLPSSSPSSPLRLVAERGSLMLYERTSVLPRAFFIGHALRLGSREAVRRAMAQPDFDPRAAVLLEEDGPERGENAPDFGAENVITPAILHVTTPEKLTVKVEAPSSGYVILGDAFAPGWEVTVDGRPSRVLPAYLALRAVEVRAGRHIVEFRYRPRGFFFGLWLAAITLLGSVVWLSGRRLIRRRAARDSHPPEVAPA